MTDADLLATLLLYALVFLAGALVAMLAEALGGE